MIRLIIAIDFVLSSWPSAPVVAQSACDGFLFREDADRVGKQNNEIS